MKLAIISTFPPRKCGIGIYTKKLADSIKDVKIISLKEHKYSDKRVIGMIDNSMGSFRKAASYINENGYKTVLIEHEYAFYNPLYFILFLMFLKIKSIKVNIEMHTIAAYNDFLKKNIFRLYNFFMFIFSDKVIVHTNYAKNRLLGSGFFKNKVWVLPLAIPETKKAAQKKVSKEIKLLCFGFIWHDKGTDTAIRAFGDVENVKLKIVGSINPSASEKQRRFFEKIKNMAKAYKNIEIIDRFVSEQEKEKLYGEADFIVMPYRSISQSAVLTEIWSLGKIPICSNLTPLREEIRNNEYGILFRKEYAEDLKNVVLKIVKDKKMQEKIIRNIRKLSAERSFKETAKKLTSIIS